MEHFTENYFKRLIKGTILAFEKHTTLSEELDMKWSFENVGNDKKVIVRYCNSMEYNEIQNDSMTENGTELIPDFDDDYFIISIKESDFKFCEYVEEILERLSVIKFNN